MTGAEILFLKVAIVISAAGFFVGLWRGYRDFGSPIGSVAGGLIFAVALPVVVGFIGGLVYGVYWVLTS